MKQKNLLSKLLLLVAVMLMGAGTAWSQSWVKTDITDLSDGDVVVVLETAKYNRALLNAEATSSGSVKASSEVTLSADGSEITSTVDANIQWVFGGSSKSFTLKSNDNASRQLWCRDNNDALRVKASSPGSAYVGTFTWDDTYKMMQSTSYTRYVGIWKNSDTDYQWRAYNSQTSTNIKGCETSFYKYTTGTGKIATTTTINATELTNTDLYKGTSAGQLTATVATNETTLTNATVQWSSSKPEFATIDESGNVTLVAEGTTVITAFYAGDDTYNASSATYELTVENNDPSNLKATFDFSSNKYNWVSTSDGGTYYDGSGYNATEGDITIGFSGKVRLWESSGSYTMRFYSDDTYGRGKMTLTAADGYVITGVSISGTTLSFQNPSSGTINGGEWTGSAQVLTIEKGSSTSNFNKVEVSYKQGIILPTPTVTIDATGITNTDVYTGTVAGSLAATVTYNDAAVTGATVTWSGDKDEVATIDAATGAVTLVAAGSVTFTATFAGNDDYNKATATYKMTVTSSDPNVPGTENNPYTVAQAITEIKAGNTGSYYVSGIISKISSTSVISGGKLTYFISDDGTTTNQLQVYHGKNLNDTEFTSVDDIALGDKVVVYGPFTYYNDNTPELNDGNYLVSLKHPASITVNPATVNVSAEFQEGTLAISYENLTITGMDDFDIQYYDADGKKIDEPEWIVTDVAEQDPQIGEGYVVSYVIATNRGDARTAYFKVFAAGESDFVYSNKVTINQAKFVETTKYTLATSITSGKHYVIASGTDGAVKVMGAQNNNNRAAVDGTVSGTTLSVVSDAGATEFVVYGPDASGFYTIYDAAKGYLYAASKSSNYLRSQTTNDANGKWSISIDGSGEATVVAQGSNTNKYMRFNSTLFSCYGEGSSVTDLVYFYEKDGEATPTETITVTDAKYATYCSENALDFEGTGLTAYIADQKGTKVTFEKITKVPAYTGVLVKADGAGSFTVSSTSSVDDATSNDLEGVIAETPYTGTIYVLMNGDKGIGFYKTTQPKFTLSAHTAYLPASIGTSRTFIGLDEATAIDGIVAEKESNGEIYNLSGQRVNSPKKGLYIMDGKKVLVK